MRSIDPTRGPVRVAFVGRAVLHRHWTQTIPAGGVDPVFLERSDPQLLDRLAAHRPAAVVVFGPQDLPAGLAGELDATTIAVLPDHLPLAGGEARGWDPVWGTYESAVAAGGLPALTAFDTGEYDRVVAADPVVSRVAPELGVWRSPPLPVDDALFLPPRARAARHPHALFIGESTAYREEWLVFAKHGYDLTHYAFGLTGERLRRALEDASIGVVVHADAVLRYQPTVALHLAAGHLVIAQELSPTRGLEPGLDHLLVKQPHELLRTLDQLAARPEAWGQVRERGRMRAEAFRASRCWPRLLADAAADLAAFGGRRRAVAH